MEQNIFQSIENLYLGYLRYGAAGVETFEEFVRAAASVNEHPLAALLVKASDAGIRSIELLARRLEVVL